MLLQGTWLLLGVTHGEPAPLTKYGLLSLHLMDQPFHLLKFYKPAVQQQFQVWEPLVEFDQLFLQGPSSLLPRGESLQPVS